MAGSDWATCQLPSTVAGGCRSGSTSTKAALPDRVTPTWKFILHLAQSLVDLKCLLFQHGSVRDVWEVRKCFQRRQ